MTLDQMSWSLPIVKCNGWISVKIDTRWEGWLKFCHVHFQRARRSLIHTLDSFIPFCLCCLVTFFCNCCLSIHTCGITWLCNLLGKLFITFSVLLHWWSFSHNCLKPWHYYFIASHPVTFLTLLIYWWPSSHSCLKPLHDYFIAGHPVTAI